MALFPAVLPLSIGIILLSLSVFLLFRVGVFSTLIKIVPCTLMLASGVGLILVSSDIMSYRQLLNEELVATLHFEKLGPQSYGAKLIDRNNEQHYFQINGDQWQIDARFIKWYPRLARLGFSPLFRLERIGGRYADISQELHEPRTLYPIISSHGLDTWDWFKRFEWLHSWADASYGSATYLPMADGAAYEVKVGHSGLLARPINEKSRQAVSRWQ